MTKINITLGFDPAALAPLHEHYPQQTNPQPAYVEIDCETGEVTADWSGEIGGGVPEGVWHGRRDRIVVSPYVSGRALTDYLTSLDFARLAQRVVDGTKITQDDNYNWIGRMSDDAIAASEEIESDLRDLDDDQVHDVDEWLQDYTVIGDDLEAEAAEIEVDAKSNGVCLHGDVLEYLQEYCD